MMMKNGGKAMKRVWKAWVFGSVWVWSLFGAASWAESSGDDFWAALQEGGKVVLIRHAQIDREFGDAFLLDSSCFSERNLNEDGKAQAKKIGEEFRAHGIQVDQVLASPHCRTQDTARLAFGEFEVMPELRLIRALPEEKAKANLQVTRQLISQFNGEGNLILVTHRPNIGELIYQRLQPGEMAVLEPLGSEPGDTVFDLIARYSVAP
jgi:phosphohistidine phosphatase SixA